ncbi:unnamed protein product [Amoebophrya sp. A120]|nr:unnamed protein product [Amoebophrya sp. A120]|eukprot:GSA120T00012867001.1
MEFLDLGTQLIVPQAAQNGEEDLSREVSGTQNDRASAPGERPDHGSGPRGRRTRGSRASNFADGVGDPSARIPELAVDFAHEYRRLFDVAIKAGEPLASTRKRTEQRTSSSSSGAKNDKEVLQRKNKNPPPASSRSTRPVLISVLSVDGSEEIRTAVPENATVEDVLREIAAETFGAKILPIALDWSPDRSAQFAFPRNAPAVDCGFKGRLHLNYRRLLLEMRKPTQLAQVDSRAHRRRAPFSAAAKAASDADHVDTDVDELFPEAVPDRVSNSRSSTAQQHQVPPAIRFLFHAKPPRGGEEDEQRTADAFFAPYFQLAVSTLASTEINGFLSRKHNSSLLQQLVKKAYVPAAACQALLQSEALSLAYLHHRDSYGCTLLHILLSKKEITGKKAGRGGSGTEAQEAGATTSSSEDLQIILEDKQVTSLLASVVEATQRILRSEEHGEAKATVLLKTLFAATDKQNRTCLHFAAERITDDFIHGAEPGGGLIVLDHLLAALSEFLEPAELCAVLCQREYLTGKTFLHMMVEALHKGSVVGVDKRSTNNGPGSLTAPALSSAFKTLSILLSEDATSDAVIGEQLLAIQDKDQNATALIDAARWNEAALVKNLLLIEVQTPAPLLLQDKFGNSALHYAAYHGNMQAAAPILEVLSRTNTSSTMTSGLSLKHLMLETTNIDGHSFVEVAQSRRMYGFLQKLAREFPEFFPGGKGNLFEVYRKINRKTASAVESVLAPTEDERAMYLEQDSRLPNPMKSGSKHDSSLTLSLLSSRQNRITQ